MFDETANGKEENTFRKFIEQMMAAKMKDLGFSPETNNNKSKI